MAHDLLAMAPHRRRAVGRTGGSCTSGATGVSLPWSSDLDPARVRLRPGAYGLVGAVVGRTLLIPLPD
ncbi:MAG: hypothetical protein M3Q84_06565, partial [Actinomycetota bacterium]|nr:hypothetical protein [Actinomycetota bacterium]